MLRLNTRRRGRRAKSRGQEAEDFSSRAPPPLPSRAECWLQSQPLFFPVFVFFNDAYVLLL